MREKSWSFSPWRLRGHRERMELSRHALGALVALKADTIKRYEYGSISPSLDAFLSLADSLGISPNDLCRCSEDDEEEYQAGKHWPLPPPAPPMTSQPRTP